MKSSTTRSTYFRQRSRCIESINDQMNPNNTTTYTSMIHHANQTKLTSMELIKSIMIHQKPSTTFPIFIKPVLPSKDLFSGQVQSSGRSDHKNQPSKQSSTKIQPYNKNQWLKWDPLWLFQENTKTLSPFPPKDKRTKKKPWLIQNSTTQELLSTTIEFGYYPNYWILTLTH